ncbi:MAG: V-type ATP synthase subunit A [Planctomycetota bacterium]|jgi:V/A-type H+-transporting ATPase subunit A
MSTDGTVVRVAGPVAVATGLDDVHLHDVVRVGEQRLLGEVIRLEDAEAVIQVFEETVGLAVGAPVQSTGEPRLVELGPGLLGSVFDGVQRPLSALAAGGSPFLARGLDAPALDRVRTWDFEPAIAVDDAVREGDLLGTVREGAFLHRILVPPGLNGRVTGLEAGARRVDETVATIHDAAVRLLTRWPARQARPVAQRTDPSAPIVTGQRVIDTLFPLARGGSVTIPGGFGTGKTVQEQTLARWADADVIVYVGCGERGNEMAEVLEESPHLIDPRTGRALMERLVLVANTSNMPVAAREASVYTGMTIAEYYRDQGAHVLLLADSTSRWGEALREVSSRLGELPGEEGYPAYLPARLAEFYERAGAAVCLGSDGRAGSVSVVSTVSPPGGDFSEPVTQHSLRLAGTFWALDTGLARRRHFPAIHWTRSYTLYALDDWFDEHVAADWKEQRSWARRLLGEEEELSNIVQILGPDVLAPTQRVVTCTGRMLREDFLQQSAYDPVDAFCPLEKQYWMLKVIRHAHEAMYATALDDVGVERILAIPAVAEIARMSAWAPQDAPARARDLMAGVTDQVAEVAAL